MINITNIIKIKKKVIVMLILKVTVVSLHEYTGLLNNNN